MVTRFVFGMLFLYGLMLSSASMAAQSGAQAGTDSDLKPADQPIVITPVTTIPTARQANRIAVITAFGVIDRTMAMSIRRRIKAAENAGMDAIVLEVNSPGGELGAVLEISNTIKQSSIKNTVAWIHPDAYSGGAIIALACNEIVTSSPASMGDAFVIQYTLDGVKALSPTERTKFLPPLMADVTDSARKSGFDEYLVQAIVVDGIELWLVEDPNTGERIAINEEEYRLLFDGEVIRGKPILAAVTGGVKTYKKIRNANRDSAQQDEAETDQDKSESDQVQEIDEPTEPAADETGDTLGDIPAEAPLDTPIEAAPVEPREPQPTDYQPASPTLEDVERAFQDQSEAVGLEYPSNRVVFSASDRGKYRLVGYITDGSSAIVMREDQLKYFGFSTGTIQTDEELKAFFGAAEMVRVNESVTEKLVRFLTNPSVKFFFIAVFLIALVVEMVMAGTGIAGIIALTALGLLLGPSAMIGLSGWWELIAIVIGIICLALEAFVIPGFGVFGVIGIVALFGGLIGTFVNAGGSLSNPQMQKDLFTGSVTVLLALVTAGVGWWLIFRNAQNLPFFDRLILSGASGVGGEPQKSMLHAIIPDDGSVKVGHEGVTTTPLYPIGKANFDGEIIDVYATIGMIDPGTRVRVIAATKMRIEVEAIEAIDSEPEADQNSSNEDTA
tara:strand:- start:12230 stop:14242 length:2013 start_codon:yes stop_codon:yes gene_type:complete